MKRRHGAKCSWSRLRASSTGVGGGVLRRRGRRDAAAAGARPAPIPRRRRPPDRLPAHRRGPRAGANALLVPRAAVVPVESGVFGASRARDADPTRISGRRRWVPVVRNSTCDLASGAGGGQVDRPQIRRHGFPARSSIGGDLGGLRISSRVTKVPCNDVPCSAVGDADYYASRMLGRRRHTEGKTSTSRRRAHANGRHGQG